MTWTVETYRDPAGNEAMIYNQKYCRRFFVAIHEPGMNPYGLYDIGYATKSGARAALHRTLPNAVRTDATKK